MGRDGFLVWWTTCRLAVTGAIAAILSLSSTPSRYDMKPPLEIPVAYTRVRSMPWVAWHPIDQGGEKRHVVDTAALIVAPRYELASIVPPTRNALRVGHDPATPRGFATHLAVRGLVKAAGVPAAAVQRQHQRNRHGLVVRGGHEQPGTHVPAPEAPACRSGVPAPPGRWEAPTPTRAPSVRGKGGIACFLIPGAEASVSRATQRFRSPRDPCMTFLPPHVSPGGRNW